MEKSYILAIDQGTSSTKTIIFDKSGSVLAKAVEPLVTNYLEGGYVEQDPIAIYNNVIASVTKCKESFLLSGGDLTAIKSCGISNQRETFLVWDKTGTPLCPAVVWQCKRSIQVCADLKSRGLEEMLQSRTGLIIDPYFSGSKLIWLNQNNEAVRNAISKGDAYFGTIDTWLLYKLTGGEKYLTDYTNASRTLLFNLENLQWDSDIIDAFGLSGIKLPGLRPSSSQFGKSSFEGLFESPLSITAMIGDSHAAAFGEGCFAPGTAKATLGTGCSILKNIGSMPKESVSGMITTVCWSIEGRVDYALEGVIVSCGSVIEWLKNELKLFASSAETEAMASDVADNNGVYIIPAFSGLGAPYWEMSRKASIEGLTFDCSSKHIVRAALEAITYQIRDVLDAMQLDTGVQIRQLMINGGISSNSFVVDFLADLLDSQVINRDMPDVSALGAAYLAGLGAGVYKGIDEIEASHEQRAAVISGKYKANMERYYQGWKNAIKAESAVSSA